MYSTVTFDAAHAPRCRTPLVRRLFDGTEARDHDQRSHLGTQTTGVSRRLGLSLRSAEGARARRSRPGGGGYPHRPAPPTVSVASGSWREGARHDTKDPTPHLDWTRRPWLVS